MIQNNRLTKEEYTKNFSDVHPPFETLNAALVEANRCLFCYDAPCTKMQVIKNNLFFTKGDRVAPLLIADNEHFLREQEYLKDARIIIEDMEGYENSVKVIVYTRDVFSIGGNLSLYSPDRAKIEIREDNLGGAGHKLSFYGLMDQGRNPKYGYGTDISFRNIKGSFLNFTTGFKTFNPSFSSGRLEENNFYTRLDKQLVSRYSHWMGAAEFSFGKTTNGFHTDSSYNTYFAYSKQTIDLWIGYNFGSKAKIESDKPGKLRHFVGIRSYYNHFFELPKLQGRSRLLFVLVRPSVLIASCQG